VIDDASTDNTAQIAHDLAASDNRIEYRRHEINKGHISTYNEGLIDWSTAEYTVLLSADDLLVNGSLMRAVHIMEADKNVGMVYGRPIFFEKETELPQIRKRKWSYTTWSGAEWLEGRCLAGHNVISSPEVVVRGSVQRTVGGYCSELPHTGDLEMWLRIASVSNISYVRGVPQAFYRKHPASMYSTNYSNAIDELKQLKAAFDIFFQHHHHNIHNITDAELLHKAANRALARQALWDACRAYDHNRVEEEQADALVEFALESYPDATSLPEFGAFRRRRYLGPIICHRTQAFIGTAIVRRVCKWLWWQRWKHRGI
jgi:glycosyltransferase involved in cell wall biosynthesis